MVQLCCRLTAGRDQILIFRAAQHRPRPYLGHSCVQPLQRAPWREKPSGGGGPRVRSSRCRQRHG